MIRIDAMWLAADPIDMRAGAERLLARVVQVFGAAQARHGYLFANVRGTRVKLLVHDGFGVWCAARRLNAGRFVWPGTTHATPHLSREPPPMYDCNGRAPKDRTKRGTGLAFVPSFSTFRARNHAQSAAMLSSKTAQSNE
jgi:transposase